jgi:hypothetical protein
MKQTTEKRGIEVYFRGFPPACRQAGQTGAFRGFYTN